ncbi:TPA: hypothetical protein EYP66_16985 [Candidatus Poribacteria bacterium]|nr:hypothetical protein [Candidatus Poribacteria bacterium]
MKRLSLLFLIFSLLIYFTQGFSYSQQNKYKEQSGKQNDSVASEGEYLKYESPEVAEMPNMFSASLRMITVLLVLLALFFAVIFGLKRLQQKRGIQGKGPISVLFQLPVGSKESVCLVDAMGEILVLGVTSSQISLLFKVEDAEALKNFRASQSRGLRPLASLKDKPDSISGHQFQNYLTGVSKNADDNKSEQEEIKVATVLESLRTLRDKLRIGNQEN